MRKMNWKENRKKTTSQQDKKGYFRQNLILNVIYRGVQNIYTYEHLQNIFKAIDHQKYFCIAQYKNLNIAPIVFL